MCEIRRKACPGILRNSSHDIAKETYHQPNCMVKAAIRKHKI